MNQSDYQVQLNMWDAVIVKTNRPAEIMLMDDANYAKYMDGMKYRYYGGKTENNALRIPAPNSGHWHIIVLKNNALGPVTHSLQVIRN
ncbi:DUF1883 domain-containing protein [Bacillus sp. 1P06AnD]|uniref:DUF1883 domain-containing protein n=1 Tax=Bacillus sp. 1P06AnD TaxID=3132208 RepID=UPI0039A39EEE